MNQLDIYELYFKYRNKEVLKNINLKIKNGINVFLGPNGCGKSTLFKLLATIYPINKGNILLNDISYKDFPKKIKNDISYLPQDFNIYPTLKVKDFLNLIANLKISKTDVEKEVNRVIELTNINEFANVKMKKLSDGMRKRVGIAQAILGNPKMIIVDEPTAGLDPEQRNNFNILLKEISHDRIVIISTHIVEDIQSFYDNVTIISNKEIGFDGTYYNLVHSLDNMVYNATVNEDSINEVKRRYTVLDETYQNNICTLKIVGKINQNDFINITPTGVNITELWSYYQKEKP